MQNGNARLAGIIAIIYAITLMGGIFVHYLISDNLYTLQYSLSLPKTWIAFFTALIIGWGLIKLYRWSWWLGLAAGIYQLFGISSSALKILLSEESLPAMMIIFIVLIISFLTLLLLPSVRRQFLTD
ncbi:MAG: hypothetical protein COA34_005700 [Methylophaga sp.]|uniref:hypothetical protein n=1 Tax=Methylophaga sp. TaxID=2024840 RepID=UPI000C11C380|nr:hypothetical protein [Methylophaga sp.]MBL1457348.1 hypothetical protein [Methylophaga sp.]